MRYPNNNLEKLDINLRKSLEKDDYEIRNDKKIYLDPDKSKYTAKTPEELELILDHFTSSKTTTRVINIVNSKIDESKTYNVMKDENGNEFILIYFIHQSIPVKCEKYREGITGFAYYINKNGTVDVGFFKDGIMQTAELGLNIKFKKGKKQNTTTNQEFDKNPINYLEPKDEGFAEYD